MDHLPSSELIAAQRALSLQLPDHVDALYRRCLMILGVQQDAEDLTQETMLRALWRADRYRPDCPLRPWLLTIATNLCRDRKRTVWWGRSEGLEREMGWEPELERLLDDVRRDQELRAAISLLPTLYRETLSLYYLSEMSYREISSLTGVEVSALKQRVRRGKQHLRELLQARGAHAAA